MRYLCTHGTTIKNDAHGYSALVTRSQVMLVLKFSKLNTIGISLYILGRISEHLCSNLIGSCALILMYPPVTGVATIDKYGGCKQVTSGDLKLKSAKPN